MKNFVTFSILFFFVFGTYCFAQSSNDIQQDESVTFPSEFWGTWEREPPTIFTNTLTFNDRILIPSNQYPITRTLINVSGDEYTIEITDYPNYITTLIIRCENDKLVINEEYNVNDENNWNGNWIKKNENNDSYTTYEYRNFTPEEINEILEKAISGEISEEEIENLQILLLDKMFRGLMNNDEFGFMIQLMLLSSNNENNK